MKAKERALARELRSQEGMSIRDITRRVGASKTTVSHWVKDIKLSEAQRAILDMRNPALHWTASRALATEQKIEKFRNIRLGFQLKGRQRSRENDPLYIAGCMLYWAEGAKNRNVVKFCNSDPAMIRLFLKFLRRCYGVPNEKVSLRISCYTDKGKTVEEIENFWLNLTGLTRDCLYKASVNYDSRGKSNNKRRKLTYGICTIHVCNTEIVQSIFGAIQEYSGWNNPEWIDALPGTEKSMHCSASNAGTGL